MATTQVFHTTVPDDGTITLPSEFHGNQVDVIVFKKSDLLQPGYDDDFWREKPLDEIITEQGGPRVCTDPASLWEDFPKLWDTEAELKEFLERRKH